WDARCPRGGRPAGAGTPPMRPWVVAACQNRTCLTRTVRRMSRRKLGPGLDPGSVAASRYGMRQHIGRRRPPFVEGARTTMQVLSRFYVAAVLAGMALVGAGAARAGIGQPSDWQLGPQGPASPVADRVGGFHPHPFVLIRLHP